MVGRYRESGTATITLSGQINDKSQTYSYKDLSFSENAGGQPFIPRLWATRKIGVLLNQIRLHGETPELVDTVTRLSVRYGIITPYTSYLIQEGDINAQTGQREGNNPPPVPLTGGGGGGGMQQAPSSGAAAVDKAQQSNSLANANQAAAAPTMVPMATTAGNVAAKDAAQETGTGNSNEPIKQVNDRTFILRNGIWTDTLYTSDKMKVQQVVFLSDDYFKLLSDHPEIKDYLAIGDHVIVVVGETAYEIKPS